MKEDAAAARGGPVRVLVIGARGMVGHRVFAEARRRFGDQAIGIDRSSLDVRDTAALGGLLKRLRPTHVINCAGIVRSRSGDAAQMMAVNGELPHRLAKAVSPWGGRVLQLSTDCVFSGARGAYTEEDKPDGTDLYARSKLRGEIASAPHLTVRTSFVGLEQGTERGLLAWFLKQKGTVRGYRKAIWSGLATPFAARILLDLLMEERITGILHVSGESISKYALLKLFAEVFEKNDVRIEPVDEPAIDLSLNHDKLTRLGFHVPSVRQMVEELTA